MVYVHGVAAQLLGPVDPQQVAIGRMLFIAKLNFLRRNRRVNDFKTRFFVNISKIRSIFLPKHFFSQFGILLFFEFRVYDPKSSNRLGLTISKCKFRQNEQKLNCQIELKFCHGEKLFSGVSNKFPKSNFQKIVGNLGEHTDGRTHRHHRNLLASSHFTRAH